MLEQIMDSLATIPLLVVLIAGAITAVTDLRSFRIPNWVTLPLFASGILFHTLAASGRGLTFALLGGAAGFACLILFYVMGGVGAGDVKLTAAAGTWLGPLAAVVLFLAAALFAGIYSVGITWWQGNLASSVRKVQIILKQGITIARHLGGEERVEEVVKRDDRRRRLIPFAVMVLGGIVVLACMKFLGRT